MKNKSILAIALSVVLIFLFSCDNGTESEVTSPGKTVYGSWVRNITDSEGFQFTAELKYNQDNTYDFILLTNAPGHTNSSAEFTLSNDQITIINDADCGVIGIYGYVIGDNSLALVAADDECSGRKAAIQGVWNRK